MGLMRRISSYFKPKSQEKSQEEEFFLQNGSELQAELIAFSNGWYGIPIRSFTAKELLKATNSFAERVCFVAVGDMFRGQLEGRQVLVNKYRDFNCSVHRNEAIRDIVIAIHMSHLKNVLKLIGCCLEFKLPAPVYECAGGMLLDDLLYGPNSDNKLLSPWRRRIKIASDIASTIVYLHTEFSTPVIYMNLKPSKVMIDQYGVAKLFDFSLSISLPPGELFVIKNTRLGTIGFSDSNYVNRGYVSQKTDVYSFGMFLLILLSGKNIARVDHDGKKLPNYVMDYADNHQYDQLIDPRILAEEGGFGSENPFESFLDLALMCKRSKHEERPEMIDVAKELRLMEKGVFRPLPKTNKLELDSDWS